MSGNVFHLSFDQPPCGRCGADDVIVTGKMPTTGAFGQWLVIQLCPRCATGSSAAGALLRFFLYDGGKGTSRTAEAAELGFAWQKEAMAAHGHQRVTHAQAPAPALHPNRGLPRAAGTDRPSGQPPDTSPGRGGDGLRPGSSPADATRAWRSSPTSGTPARPPSTVRYIRHAIPGGRLGSANGSRPSRRKVGEPVKPARSTSAWSATMRVVKVASFSPASSSACRSTAAAAFS